MSLSRKSRVQFSQMAKQSILHDSNLRDFLSPFFQSDPEVVDFIKMCLRKILTQRMLLRTHWYAEIADGIEKVRASRPALRIIFLMSLAEGVARLRLKREKDSRDTKVMIDEFFKCITVSDKKRLRSDFRRALIGFPYHTFRFSTIVNILYDIRNRAVHGDDFYSFSLLDKNKKKEYVDGNYSHYGMMTWAGWKVKKNSGSRTSSNKKVQVTLDIKLTYEELRDIFIRTAIENIRRV